MSLIVQVGFPLGITLRFRRHARVSWRVFFAGAFIFALFQLVTWLPLSAYLDIVFGATYGGETAAFLWLLAMAALTSLIEEGGRFWGYKVLFPRLEADLNWENGIMYGLGHASVETMILIAGLTFVYLLGYVMISFVGPSTVMDALGAGASEGLKEVLTTIASTSWEQPLLVAVERVLTLPHQLAWSLLVLQSIASKQKRWFGFAFIYHASIAVIIPGLAGLVGLPLAELVNALFAAFSLYVVFSLREPTS